MRHHAELRLRRALSATVRAARRTQEARRRDDVALPAVAHMVADLDDVECASLLASSTAWRQRHRHETPYLS
jgi:hypothetical protein